MVLQSIAEIFSNASGCLSTSKCRPGPRPTFNKTKLTSHGRQRRTVVKGFTADHANGMDVAERQSRVRRQELRHSEKFIHEQLRGLVGPEAPYVCRDEALASCPWVPPPHHLHSQQLWSRIQQETEELIASEAVLASFFHMTVLAHDSLARSLAFLLSNKLASPTLLGTQLMKLILDAYESDPGILDASIADLQAVVDRDPACETFVQCLVFFKGFQAIQVQRVAHWMWKKGRRALALALQSRMSEVFAVDIHPAATLGRGIMMDHASGIVIGETVVVGDNVSMLHHVTLGGRYTGTKGPRHPTVGNGVLLGAGVSVLGPVIVGHNSKVGAGSVVVTNLPPYCVAVGVPAKVIKQLDETSQPTQDMDQVSDYILDYII